jgi:hypothetical protein
LVTELPNLLLTIKSGRRTPIAQIPTPDFAVPYAAPKHVNTMAEVQPIAPKNGYIIVSMMLFDNAGFELQFVGYARRCWGTSFTSEGTRTAYTGL